jgi:hypothetical protein
MKIKYKLQDLPMAETVNTRYTELEPIRLVELEFNLNTISAYNFNLINQYHHKYLRRIEDNCSYGMFRNFSNSKTHSHIVTKLTNNGAIIIINVQILNTLDGIFLNQYTDKELISMLSVELDETAKNIEINFTNLPL